MKEDEGGHADKDRQNYAISLSAAGLWKGLYWDWDSEKLRKEGMASIFIVIVTAIMLDRY